MLKREQRRKIEFEQSRGEWNALYYEVLHNLVLETTRNGIELKNMKMRLEALASRLDFSERRVRALEGVVQYRPEVVRSRPTARDRDGDRDRAAGASEHDTEPGRALSAQCRRDGVASRPAMRLSITSRAVPPAAGKPAAPSPPPRTPRRRSYSQSLHRVGRPERRGRRG